MEDRFLNDYTSLIHDFLTKTFKITFENAVKATWYVQLLEKKILML